MFVGEQLSNIRHMHEMSRAELAKELNITEQAVWQYENSYTSPKLEVILNLSKIFDVKTKFFYKKSNLYNVINEKNIAYRSTNKNTVQRVIAEKMFLEQIESLLVFLEKPVKLPSNKLLTLRDKVIQMKSTENDIELEAVIELITQEVRKVIGLDNNNNLLFLVEKCGAFILEKSMDNDIDGYSVWTSYNRPYIILNSNRKTAVRRNFDLAHELGHLLMHYNEDFLTLNQKEYNKREKEAHTFASCLLLPKEEFLNDLKYIDKLSNPRSYIDLKRKWNVSIAALGRRAYNLNQMSYQQYRHFNALLTKYKYKVNEPLDSELNFYSPGKIRSLINHVLENNSVQVNDFTEIFNLNISKITDLFNLEKNFFDKFTNTNQHFKFEGVRDIKRT